LYKLIPLEKVFLSDSQEAIWQLKAPNNSFFNTPEGFNFIPSDAPQREGKATISPQLLSAFESGDLRRVNWISKYNDASGTLGDDSYFPYKYKVHISSTLTEYSTIFRLAEQYLIRAEARNEQGDATGAISDLNIIRTRSRDTISNQIPNPLSNLPLTLNKDQIKSAIIQERRVELFAEQGFRWLDLKRTNLVNSVMAIVTPFKGGTWKPEKQLWPIPESEILNDANLQQNPGYN
jgi:hypothetical protein